MTRETFTNIMSAEAPLVARTRESFPACHSARSRRIQRRQQRGAVLIMVLWTAVMLTILVTVLAANVRLSATTGFNHRSGSQLHLDVMAAMQQAEMELMLEHMPPPVDFALTLTEQGEIRIPAYRFNGQPLNLHYPAPEGIRVRIYNHAGKINLNGISRQRLQELIEHRLGPGFDPRDVQALLAAWVDWLDPDDLLTPGGAEDAYYQSLEPPYRPRNSPQLESVEEIRLIRGFDVLFDGVNLEAAFTIHGSGTAVNPNLASREALLLLPGMNEELTEQIIAYREQQDFRTARDVGDIIPLENMVLLSPWLGFNTSNVFTVFAYPLQSGDNDGSASSVQTGSSLSAPVLTLSRNDDIRGTGQQVIGEDGVRQAAMQIIEAESFGARPRVFLYHPYGQLPDTAPAREPLRTTFTRRLSN